MPAWSGLWDNEYGEPYSSLGTVRNKENAYRVIGTMFAKKLAGRSVLRELLWSLVNGNVGDAATASHKRVQAAQDLTANVQGGARVVETSLELNRVTTSADQSRLLGAIRQATQPTYPVDKSGNGGGNKGGF